MSGSGVSGSGLGKCYCQPEIDDRLCVHVAMSIGVCCAIARRRLLWRLMRPQQSDATGQSLSAWCRKWPILSALVSR